MEPAGELITLPKPPSQTPDGSRLWSSHPTIRAFSARPGLRCPNYGHLNYGTIYMMLVVIGQTKMHIKFSALTFNAHVAKQNQPQTTIYSETVLFCTVLFSTAVC